MEVLREISNLSNYRPTKGLKNELYLLSKDEELSRREALAHFAKNDRKNSFEVVYKRLKYKLLDGVLNASLSNLPKLLAGRIKVWKRHLQIKMLIKTENRKAGIKLATQSIIVAERNNELEVVESLSKELLIHYSTIQPDWNKYQKYKNKFESTNILLAEINKIELLYQDLIVRVKTKRPIEHIGLKLEHIGSFLKNNEHYKFRYFYYKTKNLYSRTIKDEDNFIENNKSAFAFFNSQDIELPYITKYNFLSELVPLYIIKGQFPQAANAINICIDLPPKGSFNWNKILIYQCFLGFYNNKPKIAAEAYKLAHSIPKKFESHIITEKWHLIEGYLTFYAKIGRISLNKKFRLAKWLNITETRGNTSQKANLIIVELLHHLTDKDHIQFFEKSERIPNYIFTHFRGHEHKRTRYFLKMLKCAVKGNYHPRLTSAHAKKNITKLKASYQDIDTEVLEREIVSYEILWEEVLGVLGVRN